MSKPSKEEVLAKVRDLLTEEEYDIVYNAMISTPEDAHQNGVYYQFVGFVSDIPIWIQRGARAVVYIGAFFTGCDYIATGGRIAYEQVAQVLKAGNENCGIPAIEYTVFDRPTDWKLDDDKPITIYAVTDSGGGTTTTTTTPEPDSTSTKIVTIKPGGGLVAKMDSWNGLG